MFKTKSDLFYHHPGIQVSDGISAVRRTSLDYAITRADLETGEREPGMRLQVLIPRRSRREIDKLAEKYSEQGLDVYLGDRVYNRFGELKYSMVAILTSEFSKAELLKRHAGLGPIKILKKVIRTQEKTSETSASREEKTSGTGTIRQPRKNRKKPRIAGVV